MDADALVAFRTWWDRRAAAEGPTGHGAVARAFALVVWIAAWEAKQSDADQEPSSQLVDEVRRLRNQLREAGEAYEELRQIATADERRLRERVRTVEGQRGFDQAAARGELTEGPWARAKEE